MTSPINGLSHQPRKVRQSKLGFQTDDRLFMEQFLAILDITKVNKPVEGLGADIPSACVKLQRGHPRCNCCFRFRLLLPL